MNQIGICIKCNQPVLNHDSWRRTVQSGLFHCFCDITDIYKLKNPDIIVSDGDDSYQWRWMDSECEIGHWYRVGSDGYLSSMPGTTAQRLVKQADLFDRLLVKLVEKQQEEIAKLREEIECYVAMKEGVIIRIAGLERERDEAVANRR